MTSIETVSAEAFAILLLPGREIRCSQPPPRRRL